MALQWVATDLLTGAVMADLPTLAPDWPLRRTLGRYETATATLYLDGAPPNWERATMEGGSVLACYDDTDTARAIQWAGIVIEQTRQSSTDTVPLTLVTCEGYLDRRNVGDVIYAGQGQNAIVADLIARYVAAGPGIPITVRTVTAGSGQARDRTYETNDNASVYTRLTQLSGVIGGPEWTIEWEWSTDRQSIFPVLLVGDRIGVSPAAGLFPSASFELPGCVIEAQQLRSYAAGKGANNVTAYSSGEGDTTPTSGPVLAADFAGRPTFEHRYSPSSSITDTQTLIDYAKGAVAVLAPGARPVTLTAALEDAPRLGVDYRLGDDVSYRLGMDGSVKAWPNGLAGIGRAVAYELGEGTITPILAQSEVYVEETA